MNRFFLHILFFLSPVLLQGQSADWPVFSGESMFRNTSGHTIEFDSVIRLAITAPVEVLRTKILKSGAMEFIVAHVTEQSEDVSACYLENEGKILPPFKVQLNGECYDFHCEYPAVVSFVSKEMMQSLHQSNQFSHFVNRLKDAGVAVQVLVVSDHRGNSLTEEFSTPAQLPEVIDIASQLQLHDYPTHFVISEGGVMEKIMIGMTGSTAKEIAKSLADLIN